MCILIGRWTEKGIFYLEFVMVVSWTKRPFIHTQFGQMEFQHIFQKSYFTKNACGPLYNLTAVVHNWHISSFCIMLELLILDIHIRKHKFHYEVIRSIEDSVKHCQVDKPFWKLSSYQRANTLLKLSVNIRSTDWNLFKNPLRISFHIFSLE